MSEIERLQAEIQKLEEKNHFLENITNSIKDGIFYKDLDHKYIGCNRVFAEFFGLNESQICGMSDRDFFDAKTFQKFHETTQSVIDAKAKAEYKFWVEYKEKKRYISIVKSPLIDSDGKVIGIVGIARDKTEEFLLQQELEDKNIMLIQQNKLISIGEMIANIAHQWRQPLNALGLILQKLELYSSKDMLQKESISPMVEDGIFLINEMSETIDDFRDFFNENRVKEKFSVKDAIDKSFYILKSQFDLNGIAFVFESKEECFIYGYKNEFFQVIINLMNNAIEALKSTNKKKKQVTVHVKYSNDTIVMEVEDNADGIANENIEKIFEPYYTTKEKGTGLGLYMAKIIIEKHMKGKLMVQSCEFGTLFTVEIGGGC